MIQHSSSKADERCRSPTAGAAIFKRLWLRNTEQSTLFSRMVRWPHFGLQPKKG